VAKEIATYSVANEDTEKTPKKKHQKLPKLQNPCLQIRHISI